MDIVSVDIVLVTSVGRRTDGLFHLPDFCGYLLNRSPVPWRLTLFSQLSLINYTVDVYLFAAASALAASTVSRSIFGAVFPVRPYSTHSLIVLTSFVALRTTDVRLFESPVGINPSRVCCCCHDSYPYCSPALWSLFAVEV